MKFSIYFIIDSEINIKKTLKNKKHFIDINSNKKTIIFNNIEFNKNIYEAFNEKISLINYDKTITFSEEEKKFM